MRTALISILCSLTTFAVPALAQDTAAGGDSTSPVVTTSNWTLSTSVTAKTGRDFMDQGFTFTENDVIELDATLCNDGLCFNFWRADTHVKSEHETDFQVWKSFSAGAGTIQVKAAYYELAGPDVPEVKFTYTHPLSETCTIAGSYEYLWHGFKETVVKAQGACAFKVTKKVDVDASVQIAHSKNFSQWVPGGEIGASVDLGKSFGLRPFVKGFGGREPHAFFGISFSKSFGN